MPTSLGYRAILFDLFDTLVKFDRERLPLLQLEGRAVRSTVGQVHEVLRAWAPGITVEALYAGMGESWREAERLRAIDQDRKSTRLNSSHSRASRMPSSA